MKEFWQTTTMTPQGPKTVTAYISDDEWLWMEYEGKRKKLYNAFLDGEHALKLTLSQVYGQQLGKTSILMRHGTALELCLCIYRWQTEDNKEDTE